MCRMLGMTAARPTGVRDLLSDGARCLKALSQEHADGWGIALFRDQWQIHRSTACAAVCPEFASGEATLAIAHIRKKTVGELALRNTHPFQRGQFVFAHNGTVETETLRIAPEHAARTVGTTDSEKLFAFVLTAIDEVGDVERGIRKAAAMLPGLGTASFLISDGVRLFAHRLGRSLFVSHREGLSVIASEPLDAGWVELAERDVIVLEQAADKLAA
jgi:predicted glutamine amidotransferase